MNLNNLSLKELENYILSGVVESIPADVFIRITDKLQQELSEVVSEMKGMQDNYQDGWDAAISEMMCKLENM